MLPLDRPPQKNGAVTRHARLATSEFREGPGAGQRRLLAAFSHKATARSKGGVADITTEHS